MEVNSLPKQLTNVIALQFSGSSGSPLFLYIGKIISIDQLSGTIPLSNTKLKILQYILLITGDITLRYSLAIPSILDAFLFFKYYIASLISVSVISEFNKDSQTVLILLSAIFVGLRRRREFPHSIL